MATPETIQAIKDKLTAERNKLLESIADVPREIMVRPYQGGWSIKDVLAHTAMAEEVNVKFARMMVAQDAPLQLNEFAAEFPDFPLPFEVDKFNAWMTERWQKKSLDQVLVALNDTRAATLAWIDTLTDAQLERAGEHAVWGNQSVKGMFRILVIHDKFHRGDILKRKEDAK